MLRTSSPSDGKFMGNGAGYMLWTANGTNTWPEFGNGLRPSFSYTLQCEKTGDQTIEAAESYTQDTRATCAYGTSWLYDHNYTGSPQCFGFGATVFHSNLHFCGTNAANSDGGVTGITQVYFKD